MKSSEILEKSKQYIATDLNGFHKYSKRSMYICNALNNFYQEDPTTVLALKTHINDALSPHDTIEEWLTNNKYIPHTASLPEKTFLTENEFWFNQVQAYRLRWIDHLINHFQQQGD